MPHDKKLSIALPSSIVSDIPHLREKTSKLGIIGRAAAIFGVDEIIIFDDHVLNKKKQAHDTNFINLILSYMETPQYLRKQLFKIKPELKFVGVLPPLRTPHHPVKSRKTSLKKGEYREGAVISHIKNGSLVDIGTKHVAIVRKKIIPINTRVTVKILKTGGTLEAKLFDSKMIKNYWGYKVKNSASITDMVKGHPSHFIIATSRYGKSIIDSFNLLSNNLVKTTNILLIFGSPSKGLYEIFKEEGLDLEDVVHSVLNTVPYQKTETIRTEEALLITLGILNITTAKG